MSVDMSKYEVDFPVGDTDLAQHQADFLENAAVPARCVSAEILKLYISMQNRPAELGDTLAIAIPDDMLVSPLAVVQSLKRAA